LSTLSAEVLNQGSSADSFGDPHQYDQYLGRSCSLLLSFLKEPTISGDVHRAQLRREWQDLT
jgi:hypothetical protein